MRNLITGAVLVSALAIAAPAMAQGVYIGPNGVGVDSGLGYGHRYRDRDRDDRYDRRDRSYEGRSAYEHRGRRDYDDRY